MSEVYSDIEGLLRRMAGLSLEDRGRLISRELSNAGLTIDQLQALARKGKLRLRAFGDESFFGIGAPFYGDLDRAAAGLSHALSAGMMAAYFDANGLFVGPSNPKLVSFNPFAGFEFEEPDDER